MRHSLHGYGVDPARLDILPGSATTREHLATYAEVDVALDTFPYAGATTTCEALHQGVPVVSLALDRHASRMGASILNGAGFPDWVADSSGQYLDIARSLAGDLDALETLRGSLRDRLARSALYDASRVARAIEQLGSESTRGGVVPLR